MTVETEVGNLTTAVNRLAEAVNVSKATLDASVDDAQAAQSAASSSATTASGHAASAAASAAAAAATASGIAGFDLDAIAASKAVTAVDVFVYDTSKDSDGGAWRKRTQHTSWYNETLNTATRGARREFPAVAVIVAGGANEDVIIYDGDDPALPMWKVLQGSSTWRSTESKKVEAKNGVLAIGLTSAANPTFETNNRLDLVYFISDKVESSGLSGGSYLGTVPLSEFTLTGKFATIGAGASVYPLVSRNINDVAMTVLPDAPIDPATGLPVPTIAVATNGGVSVITDSGPVYNSAAAVAMNSVSIDNGVLVYSASGSARLYGDVLNSIVSNGFGPTYRFDSTGISIPLMFNGGANKVFASGGEAFSYDAVGLSRYLIDQTNDNNSMVAYTTSTYNTGWMNGDIKGAFLSSTDATSLVGSGELVTNGTFDTDVSGWSAYNSAVLTWDGLGYVKVSYGGVSNPGTIQAIVTEIGKLYEFSAQFRETYGFSTRLVVQTSPVTGVIASTNAVAGARTERVSFVATTATTYLVAQTISASASAQFDVDNISVKLADADRSVNKKGLIVNGTVTRSAVATGAELVAYSGFSVSNYLEQPYNPALDFGTGDFCVMGWFKTNDNSTSSKQILERTDRHLGFTGGGQIAIEIDGTTTAGAFECGITDDNWATVDTVRTSTVYDNNVWHYFAVVKSSGTLKAYIDGSLAASTTVTNAAGSLSNANAKLAVGARVDGTSPFNVTGSGLALIRISATAPTAEQIKKIYEDEKVLLQENAACTLYGASDAVTALAHDSDTGLLHVGTSAGRSVFQGLRRVSNTTTAVGTAISASNGLVVEE